MIWIQTPHVMFKRKSNQMTITEHCFTHNTARTTVRNRTVSFSLFPLKTQTNANNR